jgi:cyclopropane fatty-acyl-phospholipid synthase-like methyltransferase
LSYGICGSERESAKSLASDSDIPEDRKGNVMNYYNDETNAQEYIEMAEGYDGRELIEVLKQYLPEGASLLELGMGPGKDLDLLSKSYQVTGSDNAQTFLDIYLQNNPDAELLLLDARTLKTDRRFDGIYSNKVLHHLSEAELQGSFLRQVNILNPGGILLHSFWYGDREEFMHGLRFRYYTEDLLLAMVEPHFEVLEITRYSEIEGEDSIYLVLKMSSSSETSFTS